MKALLRYEALPLVSLFRNDVLNNKKNTPAASLLLIPRFSLNEVAMK